MCSVRAYAPLCSCTGTRGHSAFRRSLSVLCRETPCSRSPMNSGHRHSNTSKLLEPSLLFYFLPLYFFKRSKVLTVGRKLRSQNKSHTLSGIRPPHSTSGQTGGARGRTVGPRKKGEAHAWSLHKTAHPLGRQLGTRKPEGQLSSCGAWPTCTRRHTRWAVN